MHNGFYLGGNMKDVIEAINNNSLHEQEMQLFIGYCGWDEAELAAEIEEGSWVITY
jgi:putative transcriptional regulator